jgi:hypothetical protein
MILLQRELHDNHPLLFLKLNLIWWKHLDCQRSDLVSLTHRRGRHVN